MDLDQSTGFSIQLCIVDSRRAVGNYNEDLAYDRSRETSIEIN